MRLLPDVGAQRVVVAASGEKLVEDVLHIDEDVEITAQRTAVAPATPASGLHPQRLVTSIAAAVGGIATFLPWATVPILGTIDGTVGDGWITLGLFAGVVAAAMFGQRSQQMAGFAQLGGGVLSTIAGGVAAAVAGAVLGRIGAAEE